jgi:hypothetical protein
MKAAVVIAMLACGCAATGALAIGPTLDGDRMLRLEGDASCGPVNGNNVIALGDPNHGAIGVWSIGARITLSGGLPLSRSQGTLGAYVEYLRLGTSSSPWGFHVGLTIAGTLFPGSAFLVGIYGGPDRLARATTMDSNDGYTTTFVTNGLDLSFRARASGPDSWWQLGALYVRRGTLLYE